MTEYWDIQTGEELSDYDLDQRYKETLDEIYSDVAIAGLTYTTSYALENIDPIAYYQGFREWVDSELGETITNEEPDDPDDESGEWDSIGLIENA